MMKIFLVMLSIITMASSCRNREDYSRLDGIWKLSVQGLESDPIGKLIIKGDSCFLVATLHDSVIARLETVLSRDSVDESIYRYELNELGNPENVKMNFVIKQKSKNKLIGWTEGYESYVVEYIRVTSIFE